jgi:transcriptional regulator with XRE-family HTH domain
MIMEAFGTRRTVARNTGNAVRLAYDRLKAARLRKLLTQAELAARAGMTESTVNRLERGLQAPRISSVRKLAAALGMPADELIDWDTEHADQT